MPGIAAPIIQRPLFVACIATKTSHDVAAVLSYLRRIGESLTIMRGQNAACPSCGNVGGTFSLLRRD